MKRSFPTYLPNQNVQGMDTANKHVYMDGLILARFKGPSSVHATLLNSFETFV